MHIINTANLNEARKQIIKLKKENPLQQTIIRAQDHEFNRKIFENKDVNIVIGLENHNRKDYLKQRDSGLNEILAKLAKNNNIKIGIDLSEIKKQSPKQKAIILARIKQNIELCKRTNTQIIIINNYSSQEIMSFMLCLGANTEQAKSAYSKNN
ncbi:MAG: hypothetical protein WCX73_01590 [Candidatus Pacearchaeota archaeon]|jgi:RNase P/RNase MRP subunit p30